MSTYWIERREVGWPRYRVWRKGPTFAAMLAPDGVFGDKTETRFEGKFWTLRGAERYIASVTWKRVERAQNAAQGSNRRSVALGEAEILEGAQNGADALPDHDKRDDGGEGK